MHSVPEHRSRSFLRPSLGGQRQQVKDSRFRPVGLGAALIGQVAAMPGNVALVTFGAPAFLALQRS